MSRDLLHIHTTEYVGEDDAHLVPGKVDADAGVLAGGEGVVGVSAVGAIVSVGRPGRTDMGGRCYSRT